MKVLITLLYVCSGSLIFSRHVNLNSDKILTEFYTQKEINVLNDLVHFTDSMVIARTNESKTNKAYHSFIEKMSRMIKDSGKILVPFPERKKYDFLASLNSSVFNSIWRFNTEVKWIHYKDSVYRDVKDYKHLTFKPAGRYMNYMEKLGKTDDYFKEWHEIISVAGGISAGIAVWFPQHHREFDFNIPKYRLWAAIYLLSIEEPTYKKMKRYLNR